MDAGGGGKTIGQNISPRDSSLAVDRPPKRRHAANATRDVTVTVPRRHSSSPSAATLEEPRPAKQARSLSKPSLGPQQQQQSQSYHKAPQESPARASRSPPILFPSPPTAQSRNFLCQRTLSVNSPVTVHSRSPYPIRARNEAFSSPLSSPAVICLVNESSPTSSPYTESLGSRSPESAASHSPPPSSALPPVVGSPSGLLRVKSLDGKSSQSIEAASDGSANPHPSPSAKRSVGDRSKSTSPSSSPPLFSPARPSAAAAATAAAAAHSMGNHFSGLLGQPAAGARSPSTNDSLGSAGSGSGTSRTPFSGAVDVKPKPPSQQRKEMDAKEASWVFHPPPNTQQTFFFPEDNIEFSSKFDNGNLIQMERVGPYKYNLYSAMDCSNDERQANNRQWFHFSVRGGVKGSTVNVTVVGLMHCNMYAFDWMPVMSVLPSRPAYVRLPGKATAVPLDAVPPTPDYPMLVYRDPAERRRALEGIGEVDDGDGDGDDGGDANDDDDDGNGAREEKGKKKRRKRPVAMNLMFDFRLDYEIPLKSSYPLGHPDCPAMYIASNHPYSYTTLQANLLGWQRQAAGRAGVNVSAMPSLPPPDKLSSAKVWNYSPSFANGHQQDIYFHREVLCKTLEGRNVDLITISDMSSIQSGSADSCLMPMLTFNGEVTPIGLPHSSAHKQTHRPRRFIGKQYVVLSARVHAGECPGSHMMHGCFEFLMNQKDPRAVALRKHFVFFLVPMLNPDGVVRGHSRVDANGVDLNRMYRNPSYKRHPAAYALWALLSSLALERRLALYVDMHAHANKRGTFFYANGMDAALQVQNLLYSRLVSLNTPYLEFKSCNYSESNMSAVTRCGLSKDCSCRVVLYTEMGVLHSYAIEASYVCGKALNQMEPLAGIPGEEVETVASVRYSPATFGDTGKAMLLALLDLKGLNPVSRVPLSPYQSIRGISLWIQRQLQTELAEKLFTLAYKEYGRVESMDAAQAMYAAVLSRLAPAELPEKLTVRGCRHLPPTTVSTYQDFIPLDLASTLLAQTPPTGPPRSLVCPPQRRKAPAGNGPRTSSSGLNSEAPPSSLYTVGDSPGAGRPLSVTAPSAGGANDAKRSSSQRSQTNSVIVDEIAAAVVGVISKR